MTTEITTQFKQVVSNSVNRPKDRVSTVENSNKVEKADGRQDLPVNPQEKLSAKVERNEPEPKVLKGEELNKAVDNLNSLTQNLRRELRFSIDEDSGHAIIKVIDSESLEIVRQIPSEEVTNVLRNMKERSSLLMGAKV